MATKTNSKPKVPKASEQKSEHTTEREQEKHVSHIAAPVTGPVPPALNDTREDGAPVVGHFVQVTKGDDKGFVGIFVEMQGDNAVVRSKNDVGNRISVPFDAIQGFDPYA